MHYCEHSPSPVLARYLEAFWFVTDQGASAPSGPERVLPDGCIEWIFHLDSPFQRLVSETFETQCRSFVVGELTQFILLQPTGRTNTMGVRFRPGGAYRFMPTPLNLLTDETVATEDIWGMDGKFLEEAVLEAANDLERIELIEQFLIARLHITAARPRFEAAVREIVSSRGQHRIEHIAEIIGWSPRQLEREFRASAGLSPKALARVIRFQSLLQLVGENRLRDWVDLALTTGYADQPHMVREFREFCGQTPTEQINTPGNLAHHFVSPHRIAALLGTS
ncbi:MAG TPA: helix-turn-helix domain-containing protein [Pyrinomonadaceae bacterium]|nr:helix-turn-helix domain-containing protein [Pyrinomonadaceae bacterium]